MLYEASISLPEAVLEAAFAIPTPTEDVTLSVPPESDGGTTLRLRGKGAPRRGGGRGDLRVRLRIVLPKPVDEDLKTFVADWTAGKAFKPREEAQ